MKKLIILGLLATLAAFAQQNTVIQTSLSSAVSATASVVVVASATGINAPSATVPGSLLYVLDWGQYKGEAMQVISISGTSVTVRRGTLAGSVAAAHASGAMVLVATNPSWFQAVDPKGACSTTPGSIAGDRLGPFVTPVVNIQSGNQWLCSSITGTWVPGFGNMSAAPAATTAVASAAGLVTPSGPLFHITGTAAITGFNIPVGYNGGQICAIPDGLFTTTSANNIALASTAVVSKQLCWAYDKAAAKPFFPSY